MTRAVLSAAALDIDCAAEAARIADWMTGVVGQHLHRRGVVIGLSGGVDSAVCLALAVRALGPGKVIGLLMPEDDSSPASGERADRLATQFGVTHTRIDIGPALHSIGCYQLRDDAIRAVFPEYGHGWKNKIVIAGGADGHINFFKLVVQAPDGQQREQRLPIRAYLQIVAATNLKQRIRKTLEYTHADRLNYAVVGTPNRLEYDQGFFVKNGDGAADLKPIAHLYKTQVYAMARHLGVPAEICSAVPTTDTYSLHQGQDEFYFALPYAQMDLALWAHDHDVPSGEVAAVLGIHADQAAFIYRDIESKRRTTAYLHMAPVVIERVLDAPR